MLNASKSKITKSSTEAVQRYLSKNKTSTSGSGRPTPTPAGSPPFVPPSKDVTKIPSTDVHKNPGMVEKAKAKNFMLKSQKAPFNFRAETKYGEAPRSSNVPSGKAPAKSNKLDAISRKLEGIRAGEYGPR